MPRLRYLGGAKADLIDIHIYIATVSGSAEAGRSFVGKIQRKCVDLASLPGMMGRPRPELLAEIRSFAFEGYIVFFRYIDDAFEVVNVLEGHRDVEDYFRRGIQARDGVRGTQVSRTPTNQSFSIIAAAAETVASPGFSSTLTLFTTPSSTSIE